MGIQLFSLALAVHLLCFCSFGLGEEAIKTTPYSLHFHRDQEVELVQGRHLGEIDQIRTLTAVTLAFDVGNNKVLCSMQEQITVYSEEALERMNETHPPVTFQSSNCVFTFLNETDFDGVVVAAGKVVHFHRFDHKELELDDLQQNVSCISREPKREGRMLEGITSYVDREHELPRILKQKPDLWKSCYPRVSTGYRFKIGIVAGKEFKRKFKNVEARVQSIVSAVNFIYANQLNVRLVVGHLYKRNGPWNTQCSQGIKKTLTVLTAWKKPSTQGAWHLIDSCYGSSGLVVGMAYLGALCDRYSTGVNYCYGRGCSGGFKVLAHELGHNFGAQHSFEQGLGRTGGIMDYGPGTLNGIYQFNTQYRQKEICSFLSSKVGTCKSFKLGKTGGNNGGKRNGGGGKRGKGGKGRGGKKPKPRAPTRYPTRFPRRRG